MEMLKKVIEILLGALGFPPAKNEEIAPVGSTGLSEAFKWRLWSIYLEKFNKINDMQEDQINWDLWEALDKTCMQLADYDSKIIGRLYPEKKF